MSTIQIQCQGCNRHFTHRGLSQHMSKAQRLCCRADYTTLQSPSASVPHAVSPLDSIPTPCVLGADIPHDESTSLAVNDRALDANDLTDALDSDAYEALSRGNNFSGATTPDLQAPDDIPQDPVQQDFQTDADNSDVPITSTVVVDRFPSGSPGAPIPGMPSGPSMYESHQATLAASVWAPFSSQCDWELARWAKTRSPTSSAVTDLLAIPEV